MISPSSQAKGSVFAIVISEKGGAERREVFERPEISVGRVQGNDLMLPKGNVSKRHARLIFRDGRFIVTDLNSTNGTYVNRRRISQATIVREGDRIYIGDFVLRIDMPDGEAVPADSTGSGPVPARHSVSQAEEIQAYPIEQDPDEPGPYPAVPGPPRVPSGARVGGLPTLEPGPSDSQPSEKMRVSSPDASRPSIPLPPRPPPTPAVGGAELAYRDKLRALVERVREAAAMSFEQQLTTEGSERLGQLMAEQATSGAEEKLLVDARNELCELGPLGALLADPEVSEISASSFDHVSALRKEHERRVEPPFSNEHSLQLALARLCAGSGVPLNAGECLVERRLPDGSHVWAALRPASISGPVLMIRRPQRIQASFEELVRHGTVSRAIATFLSHCSSAGVNVLVVGPRSSALNVASALAAASGASRVTSANDVDEVSVVGVESVRVNMGGGIPAVGVLRVATRVPNSRLVVEWCSGEVMAATLDVVNEGGDGVIAWLPGSNLRRTLTRSAAAISVARPGLDVGTARDWLASGFDIAIEVGRLRDGRDRMLRVCELAGTDAGEIVTNDVFSFTIERTAAGGSIEGTFHASGHVPRVVEDIAATGIAVESSLFTRPPSR